MSEHFISLLCNTRNIFHIYHSSANKGMGQA